jgi:hypothetical protein
MATWQFDTHLVPASVVAGRETALDVVDSAWRRQQPPSDYRDQISRPLPPAKSWSLEVLIWGSEDGDRIDILIENTRVANILVRIDARVQPSAFAQALSGLAASWECVLIDGASGSVIQPDREAIRVALASSEAAAFVADPEAFLRQLSG